MKQLKQYNIHILTPKHLAINYPVGVVSDYDVLYEGELSNTVDGCTTGTITQVSENWFYDGMKEVFETDTEVFTSFITVKWSKKDLKNPESLAKVNGLLDNGIIVNGVLYQRLFRSPSAKRAGGCILTCLDRDAVLSYFSLMLNLDIEVVVAKLDAVLALMLTSSHVIGTKEKPFNPRIRVVADIKRTIKQYVKTIASSPTAPNPLGKEELEGLLYDVIYDRKGNPDVRYQLFVDYKDIDIELVDGCGIVSFDCDDVINDYLQLTDEERIYSTGKQVRAPLIKGMLVRFDIVAWCDEHNIKYLIDIYGEKFNPREVDMIIPKSMFKGAMFNAPEIVEGITVEDNGLFNSMDDYYTAVERVCQGNWFRVANISKEKEPWHTMTYQYLQVLNIAVDDIIRLATPFTSLIKEGITEDIAVAKKLLNMIVNNHDYTNYLEKSMISKVQELLELCPALFHNKFVQKQIIKTVKRSVEKLKEGNVPVEGSYHYIVGDVTLLFVNAIYEEGSPQAHLNEENIKRNGRGLTLKADDQVGLLPKGVTYLADSNYTVIGFRSPLVDMSEPAKLKLETNAERDKWFGHLKGIIIMNSFEATALGMSGADYDGDKIYITANPIIMKGYMPNQPIIISPLEGAVAKKGKFTWDALRESDLRSLDNKTGLYTNMATYYTNELYHLIATNQADNAVREESSYKITMLRIASAGEIDYPKHGTRFHLPEEVQTFLVPHWLRPDKSPKQAPMLETPMEHLFRYTDIILQNLDKDLPVSTIGTEDYIKGKNVDIYEVNKIMPYVKEYETAYRNELFNITRELEENPSLNDINEGEYVRDRFKTLYNTYIDLCSSLTTDRKALARACVNATFKEGHKNDSFTFPFLVAYDGVLQNLAEYDFTSLRLIPAKALDKLHREFNGTTNIDGNDVTYMLDGAPFIFQIKTPLPKGRYDLVSIKGQHYIKIDYRMTAEEKQVIIKGAQTRDIERNLKKKKPVVHRFDVMKGVDYTFTISGMGNKEFIKSVGTKRSAVDVKAMLQANNDILTFKNIQQKGAMQTGVFIGQTLVGVVSSIDGYDDMQYVDLCKYIDHAFKVVGYGDVYGKYGTNPLYTLKVTIQVKTSVPCVFDLDTVHARCDLGKWYWNTDICTFASFGYKYKDVRFVSDNAPKLGDVFAQILVEYGGVDYAINIQRTNEGITAINAISNGVTYSVDHFGMNLKATILRCVSYKYAEQQLKKAEKDFIVQPLKDVE